MEPSALYKHTAAYSEQDNCLFFALGLAKAADDLRRKAETSPAKLDVLNQPETSMPMEELEWFLLGLLSFSRRYARVVGLQDRAQPAAIAPAGHKLPERPIIRELLR